MKICQNCGIRLELDSRFCESCGERINTDLKPENLSDDYIAGQIADKLSKGGSFSYQDIVGFTENTERADRIVAQLENTGLFQVQIHNNQYFISNIKKIEKSITDTTEMVYDIDKFKQLEELLNIGPISLDTLPGILDISDLENTENLVSALLDTGKYKILSRPSGNIITKI